MVLNFADLPANDPKPWTFGALIGFIVWYISRFIKQKDWVPSLALFWQIFSISTTFLIIHETSRHFSIELGRYWGGLETFDPFSIFWELTIDIITIFVILLAWNHPELKRNRGEFFALLMIAGASLMFMVASSDLVAIQSSRQTWMLATTSRGYRYQATHHHAPIAPHAIGLAPSRPC